MMPRPPIASYVQSRAFFSPAFVTWTDPSALLTLLMTLMVNSFCVSPPVYRVISSVIIGTKFARCTGPKWPLKCSPSPSV
jgi:hypothetical protein